MTDTVSNATTGMRTSQRMLAHAWAFKEMKFALGVFLFLIVLAAVGPVIIPASAIDMNVGLRFLPPIFFEGGQWPHIFGTDQLGRDLFLRSLIGLRNALMLSVVAVICMFVLGCGLGIYAGYKGGWIDTVIMRITDVQMSIPVIILAVTVLGMSRPTPFSIIMVLVIASWPVYARVARSVALAEKEKEHIRAARIIGAGDLRIMLRHMAPQILPPIAFVAVLDIARMMIFEAIFGFIGIGIQPPTPTFGTIISSGTQYLLNSWWITVAPGVLLAVTLTSLNLVGGVLERSRNHVLQGGR